MAPPLSGRYPSVRAESPKMVVVMDERRDHVRAEVSASAIVLTRHNRGVAVTIDSLSISGARLAGPLTVDRGEVLSILFEIDGHPIEVSGEVIRVESRDLLFDHFSVRFGALSPEARTLIGHLVRDTLDRRHDRRRVAT
jgi:hypothetical protein